MGHDAVILTATPYGEAGAGRIHSQYTYDGLTVHCLDLNLMPHRRFKDTYYRPELHGLLRDVVSDIGPDLVHVTHLINLTATLLDVLREMRIPTMATFTDFYGICFNNKLERYDGTLCRGPDRHSMNCLCCYMKAAQDFPSGSFLRYLPRGNRSRRLIAAFLRHLIRLPGLRRGTLAGQILDVTERNKTLKYLYGVYAQIVAPSDFLYEAYVANDLYPRERTRSILASVSIWLRVIRHRGGKKTGGSDSATSVKSPLTREWIFSSMPISGSKAQINRLSYTGQPIRTGHTWIDCRNGLG